MNLNCTSTTPASKPLAAVEIDRQLTMLAERAEELVGRLEDRLAQVCEPCDLVPAPCCGSVNAILPPLFQSYRNNSERVDDCLSRVARLLDRLEI